MARAIKRLTSRSVATIDKPGRHADGDGLYLIVDPGGAKRWALLVSVHGRRREFGLGRATKDNIPQARQAAAEAKEAIRRGEDPRRIKGAAPALSEAARTMIAEVSEGWRGRDTKTQWDRSLLTYSKDIGDIPIDLIRTDDVVRVIRPHWMKRPETGRKLRQRLEALLDYAAVKGWRDQELKNPARLKGHLDRLLPRQSKAVKHHRAIRYEDAPTFMADLAVRTPSSARALEWTIFTAAREGMTRFATWREIRGDLWIIPASRMKEDDRGDFIVPLPPQALAVLESVRIEGQKPDDLIFPGARGKVMSDQTMDALLDRMKVDATPHGFRSTFRDWAGDMTDHAREVAEAALAHQVGDETERAYRRGDALKKRRQLLADWADYLRPRPETAEAPRDE